MKMKIIALLAALFFAVATHAQEHKPKLRDIIALTALHVGAVAADIESTRDWERRCPDCFETGFPLDHFTRKPSVADMASFDAGEITLGAFVAAKMQHSRHAWVRSLFWVPQSAVISTHTLATIGNLKRRY